MKMCDVRVFIYSGQCGHFKARAEIHWQNSEMTDVYHPTCFDTEELAADSMIELAVALVRDVDKNGMPKPGVQEIDFPPKVYIHEESGTVH